VFSLNLPRREKEFPALGMEFEGENRRVGERGRVKLSKKAKKVEFDAESSDEENGNGNGGEEEDDDELKSFDWEAEMRRRVKEIEEMRELEKKAEELQGKIDEEERGGGRVDETEEEKKMRVRKELEKVRQSLPLYFSIFRFVSLLYIQNSRNSCLDSDRRFYLNFMTVERDDMISVDGSLMSVVGIFYFC